jgi:metal-responsive CopG/Arc/MetJ family transcriptional regulator
MSTDKPKIILVLERDFINRIDDYRYSNRIPSRSEAIRKLILEALQKYENIPKKKPKKNKGDG